MHDNSLGAEGWATHWAPKTAIQTTKCTKHTKNERLAERTLFTHSAGTSIPQNLCCFVYLALCGAPHNADYVEFVRVNAGLPQYSFVGLQTHSFPLSPSWAPYACLGATTMPKPSGKLRSWRSAAQRRRFGLTLVLCRGGPMPVKDKPALSKGSRPVESDWRRQQPQ
jgi:hypothetical protein